MNPLLWRPLTGILSFNMPPYAFDLSPFLGSLTDGREHNITVDVVNDKQGYWFLNGVLALRRDGRPVQGGHVEIVDNGPLIFSESIGKGKQAGEYVQQTSATRKHHVRGHIILASGERVASELSAELSAWIVNRYIGEDALVTT